MSSQYRWLKGVSVPIEIAFGNFLLDSFRDAIDLSARLGCAVTFTVNGVKVTASPEDTDKELHKSYLEELRLNELEAKGKA